MKRNGFTLMEILVVLAILGMGLALITSMTTHSARYSERVEEETNVQLACENMMNSILAGNTVALIGVEIPIPDAPRWSAKVEALDGPIEKVVAIRITAQRYETFQTLSPDNPELMTVSRIPETGRTIVVKEWALRSSVRTRVVTVNAQGESQAVDGTGDTLSEDLARSTGDAGGLGLSDGFTAPLAPENAPSPFDVFEDATGLGTAPSGGLGAGLGGGL